MEVTRMPKMPFKAKLVSLTTRPVRPESVKSLLQLRTMSEDRQQKGLKAQHTVHQDS